MIDAAALGRILGLTRTEVLAAVAAGRIPPADDGRHFAWVASRLAEALRASRMPVGEARLQAIAAGRAGEASTVGRRR